MRSSKLVLASSVLCIIAILLCGSKLSAQSSPASAPAGPPAAANPAQDSSPSVIPPIRVNAREVFLDINVTDAKGNPVHGLTRDDFTILEDGKPMLPRGFREHRSDRESAESPAPAKPSLPPNTFTNAGAPETVRPLNVLLIDSLDTPLANQSIVQKRLAEFVGNLPAGTRMAVFSLSPTGQLSLVQGFTADPQLLKNALKSKKLNLGIPTLEDSGQDVNNDISPDMLQQAPAPTKNNPSPPPSRPPQPRIDLNVECNHAAMRGQYTISAITQIARYLSGIPGRKNLIWYTGVFPTRMRDKQGEYCYDFGQDLGVVEGLLSGSHVAVYPVDSRAMDIQARNDSASRIVKVQAVEHLVMEATAEHTGGKAFYNTNDLAGAAEQALNIGSNYYAVTYTPINQINDTRLRTISVKVDQPDLTLTYKPGYRALPPNTTLSGKPVERVTPLQSAMMPGTLPPTEVLFQVNAASAPATDAALPPGNSPGPAAMKPPYRHLTLNYLVDINGIQFDPSPDGNYQGQFEYAVNVYNSDDGKLVNSSTMAAKPSLSPDAYQSMLNSGAKLRQEIAVPAKGDYTLRVGVHDLTTGHLGAIEVPVSSIAP
jgi:VWFA-related protein